MYIYNIYAFSNSNMRILPSIWLQSGQIHHDVQDTYTGKISCVRINTEAA